MSKDSVLLECEESSQIRKKEENPHPSQPPMKSEMKEDGFSLANKKINKCLSGYVFPFKFVFAKGFSSLKNKILK